MTRNVADADAWFPYDRCVRHDRKKRVIAAKKAVKPGVNSNCLLSIASHIMPKRFLFSIDTNCTDSKQGHMKQLVFKCFKIFGTLRWPPLMK